MNCHLNKDYKVSNINRKLFNEFKAVTQVKWSFRLFSWILNESYGRPEELDDVDLSVDGELFDWTKTFRSDRQDLDMVDLGQD
jgi:hypothetical protein